MALVVCYCHPAFAARLAGILDATVHALATIDSTRCEGFPARVRRRAVVHGGIVVNEEDLALARSARAHRPSATPSCRARRAASLRSRLQRAERLAMLLAS